MTNVEMLNLIDVLAAETQARAKVVAAISLQIEATAIQLTKLREQVESNTAEVEGVVYREKHRKNAKHFDSNGFMRSIA